MSAQLESEILTDFIPQMIDDRVLWSLNPLIQGIISQINRSLYILSPQNILSLFLFLCANILELESLFVKK